MRFLSGEFFLDKKANGGTVVLKRSLWVTFLVYLVAFPLKVVTDPESVWGTLSLRGFLGDLHDTAPWAGAVFAGAYAAFYARFSSQWAYLAGLYNQILQAELAVEPDQKERIEVWWVGFIEDALELHLATKPMFAAVIRHLLTKPGVRKEFENGVPGGKWRLPELQIAVDAVAMETEKKWEAEVAKKGRKTTTSSSVPNLPT
ncbi:hypothetical protein [Myxococcus virescens]|nr:hypothetical protein [Myxococcus virescens]SDE29508.1 hypothetical protein SAMN04488504_105473 [Myxococcus virescens]